jgi:hypothetical protein
MNTKTLVIAAVVIAATASLALAPTFTTTALAAKGGVNPGGGTTCFHNGNGDEVDCPDNGNSAQPITTCKVHGKFVPENPNDDDEVCP